MMKRRLVSILVLVTALVLSSVCVSFAVSTQTHPFTGVATHTDEWKKWGDTVTDTKYNLFRTKKTIIKNTNYKGGDWYTDWYAKTDNYYHVKGSEDVNMEVSVTKCHKVSGSISAKIKVIGIAAGYSFSTSSSEKIEHRIAKSEKTGYYRYCCRVRMIDLKHSRSETVYKKEDGEWVKDDNSYSEMTGAMVRTTNGNTAVYYKWRRA